MSYNKITTDREDNFIANLPYWSFVDGVIVNVDGTFSKGMKLGGIDIWTLPLHMASQRLSGLHNTLHSLPPGYHLQFIYDVNNRCDGIIGEYEKRIVRTNDISTALQSDRIDFLKGQADLRNIDIYLFISKKFQNVRDKLFGKIKSETFIEITEKMHERAVSDINNIYDLVTSHLKNNLNIDCHSLDDQDYLDLIYKYLNPTKAGIVRAPCMSLRGRDDRSNPPLQDNPFHFKGYLTAREQVCHSSCEMKKDHLSIDDKFIRVFTLKIPVDQTYPGIVDNITNGLKFFYRMVLDIETVDNGDFIAKLELERKRKVSFLKIQKEKNVNAEASLTTIDKALIDQKSQQFQFVKISISFLLQTDTLQELEEQSKQLMTHVRNIENASLIKEEFTQLKYFLSTLPGNGYKNDRLHTCSSFNAAELMPIYRPLTGTSACDAILHTDRKTLFKFSPFSSELRSYNQIIIGAIGSGKSFASNYLLNMQLIRDFNSEVMILDLGDSFKKTALIWGGQYITIDLNDSNLALNPFCHPSAIFIETGEFNNDMVNFIAKLLLLMIRGDENDILQINVLEEAIRILYKRAGNKPPLIGDYLNVLTNYSDYSKDKDDIKNAKHLSKLFNLFTQGSYSQLFNRPSTIDFSDKFFCVDIQGASNNTHLKEIVTSIVGMHILRRLMANRNNKRIILDEFASSLSHQAGYKLCELIARNCRKFGGSVTAITQGAKDFLSCPAASTILDNSNIKWIMRSEENADFFRNQLELNERDLQLIRSLTMVKGKYSQIFLKYQDQKVVLNLYATPVLYWCCTTNPQDLRVEQSYYKKYSDKKPFEVIQMLAKEYPYGVISECHSRACPEQSRRGEGENERSPS